jgi:diaminopimelate epimerase
MGRARVGEEAEVAGWHGQEVTIGNPQFAVRVDSLEDLAAIDLPAVGPAIETDARYPSRTNVSFWAQTAPDAIRARIFERGVGETLSSGTGAVGAAIDHVLRGGDSPVTVVLDGGELTVDVGEDFHVDLTGWAEPVFSGEWPLA